MSIKSKFPGFPEAGLAFLAGLKKHNDREWFNARKPIYEEQVRQPMLVLVGAIHQELLRFAPDYVGDPAKCIFRIYRDTRFSNDKTPYKTHVAAVFRRTGMDKEQGTGFYVHVDAEQVELGGGLYMSAPDTLFAVRTHVAENAPQFRKTFENAKVRKLLGELKGEAAVRIPKGFATDHPAADLIRHKQFLLGTTLDSAIATTPKLLPEIVARFEAIAPFVAFLDRPLLGKNEFR